MGIDEVLVAVFGAIVAVRAGGSWYRRLWHAKRLRANGAWGMWLLLTLLPALLVAALVLTLERWAAGEVRGHVEYVLLFSVLGVVWLAAAVEALSWMGISVVDDVIERQNVAAGWAAAGGLMAITIGYGFANLGEGSTIWMTIGPALLVFVVCSALWAAHRAARFGRSHRRRT